MGKIIDQIKQGKVLVSDGAWGTFLQKKGMRPALIATFLYNRAVKIPLLPLLIIYFGLTYSLVLMVVMTIGTFAGVNNNDIYGVTEDVTNILENVVVNGVKFCDKPDSSGTLGESMTILHLEAFVQRILDASASSAPTPSSSTS